MPRKKIDNYRCFTTSIMFFICTSCLYSSHIIGGDITYDFVRFNEDRTQVTYLVELALYRDPTGVAFDDYASFGVFKQNSQGGWEPYQIVPIVYRGELHEYNPLGDPCKTRNLNEEKLEYTNYTFEVTLEITDQNYMISYQKCCRNYTINNVLGDGEIGAVYDVIITPQSMQLGNNSPKFGPIPPLFVCSGYDLSINHSATDIDGDSLVYKFCTPLYPGIDDGTSTDLNCCGCTNPNPAICPPPYPELVYEPGFSPENPMQGSPQVTIDNNTGMITGRPELLGPYVVVVCVDEYRDGRLIGTVRRDFELNTIICSDYLKAEVESDSYYSHPETGKTIAYFESCKDRRFSITNLSRDEQYIRDYIWEIYDSENNLIFNRSGVNSRDVTLELPDRGRYSGYMILNDDALCYDTAFLEFLVAPEVNLDFTMEYDKCSSSPVSFNNTSSGVDNITEWFWLFGDGSSSTQINPSHNYQEEGIYSVDLVVLDMNGCEDIFSRDFDYSLFPSSSSIIKEEICAGSSYQFGDQTFMTAGEYEFYIEDSNGCDSLTVLNLSLIESSYFEFADTICKEDEYLFNGQSIMDAGQYLDTLTNAAGCDSLVILNLYVGENLTRLEIDQPINTEYGSTLTLTPVVEGGKLIYKQWSDEQDEVLGNSIVLNYLVNKDEWLFFESLNELYCFAQDSAYVRSTVLKGVYIPDIFSPNNDGVNDLFFVGSTKSLKLLDMKIFDRWGNYVFGSEDTSKSLAANSWDGMMNGKPADIGVYVYMIELEYVNGDRASQKGTVQLIR